MKVARVLSQEDLYHERRLWFGAGFTAALIVVAVAIPLIWQLRPQGARLVSGAPAIVNQNATETTATIPTLHYGVPRECRVLINHRRGFYAVNC